MQPCKTGDQPYSNASPNGEFSLAQPTTKTFWKIKSDTSGASDLDCTKSQILCKADCTQEHNLFISMKHPHLPLL